MRSSSKCLSCGSYNVTLDQGMITCHRCEQTSAVQPTTAPNLPPQHVNPFLGTTLVLAIMWILATIVGYILSYLAIFQGESFFWETLSDVPGSDIIRWTSYGIIFGVVLGVSQWLVLRSFGVLPLRWIGASIIGWILGFWSLMSMHYLQITYQQAAYPSVNYSIVNTFEAVKWGLLGIPHGVIQWVILRFRGRRAILWPITLSLGWCLGLLLGYLRWESVAGYGISMWTPAFGGSLMVALVSGVCLAWIMQTK